MYHSILLPIDLTDEESWQKALPKAIGLAETFGAKLEILAVVPDMGLPVVPQFFPDDFDDQMTMETSAELERFAREHVPGSVTVQVSVASGTIYREILRVAGERNCDLIVMGSHRPELSDYLLGPNAARVVRHAKCSVLVVRE